MPPDLASLLTATAARDQAAYGRLVAIAGPWLHALAGRFADHDLAADAVQDVLIDCWFHGGRFSARPSAGDPSGDRAAGAWLARLAVRAVIDRQRADRRRRARERAMAPSPIVADASAALPDRWLIAETLGALGEADRAVLALHAAGADAAVIAATLRCSAGAARVRVHRALGRLRRILARRGVGATAGAVALSMAPGPGACAAASDMARWLAAPRTTTAVPLPIPLVPTLGSLPMSIALVALLVVSVAVGGGVAVSATAPEPLPVPSPVPRVAVDADPLDRPIDLAGRKPGWTTLTIHEIAALMRSAGVDITLQTEDANGIARDGMSQGAPLKAGMSVRALSGCLTGYWRLERVPGDSGKMTGDLDRLIADHPDAVKTSDLRAWRDRFAAEGRPGIGGGGYRLTPEPVGAGRASQRERLKAWAYLPLDIDAGDGLTLPQLEAVLAAKLGMPIVLAPIGVDRAWLDQPVLRGRVTGIPARRLIGELVGTGDWQVDYANGVRMDFTPRPEATGPVVAQ